MPVTGSADGLLTGIGTAISGPSINDYRVPYSENWSFNIQQQLPGNILVEAGYVGARGLELSYANYDLNQLRPEQLTTTLQQKVPNPFYGLISTGTLAAATVPCSALIVPYPQYTGVTQAFPTGATSIYHAFQLKAQKRFTFRTQPADVLLGAETNRRLLDHLGSRHQRGRSKHL